MAAMMDKYFHPSITWRKPEGGFFIMAFCPRAWIPALCAGGIRRKVITVPGYAFLAIPARQQRIRLNFSPAGHGPD